MQQHAQATIEAYYLLVMSCYIFATMNCVICVISAFSNFLNQFYLFLLLAFFFTDHFSSSPVCCDIIVQRIEQRSAGQHMLQQAGIRPITPNHYKFHRSHEWVMVEITLWNVNVEEDYLLKAPVYVGCVRSFGTFL